MERARRIVWLVGLLAVPGLAGEAPPMRGGPPPSEGTESAALPVLDQPMLPAVDVMKRPRPLTDMERRIEILRRILAFQIVESFPTAHPSPLAGLAVRILRPGFAMDEREIARERADGLQAKGVHVPGYGIVLALSVQVRQDGDVAVAPPQEKARPLWERIEESLTTREKASEASNPAQTAPSAAGFAAPQDLAGRPTWKQLVDLVVTVVTECSPRLEGLPAGESVIVIAHGVEGDVGSAIPGLDGEEDSTGGVPQTLVVALRKADLDAAAEGTLDKPTLLTRAVIVIPPPPQIEVKIEPEEEQPEPVAPGAPGQGT